MTVFGPRKEAVETYIINIISITIRLIILGSRSQECGWDMREASAAHEYFGREIPRQDLIVVNRIMLKLL